MNRPHPFIAKIDNRWRARRVARGLALLATDQEATTKSRLPWHCRNARYYQTIHDYSFFIV
jgi:hypothetical protein